MDHSVPLVLLLSCMIQGSSALGAQIELVPETLTVLRGEEARLTCSTTNTQWTVMVWLLNSASVLTISREHGVLPSSNPNVTAEKNSSRKRDSWVFVLKSAERDHQGQVTCDLQNFERKTASLFVQEKGDVRILGGNKTAWMGHWILFQCQATGWHPGPTLQWEVNGKQVSQSDYNLSSEMSAQSLYTVSSNLSMQAAESSHVDCLASVSALHTPLTSRAHLTVVAEVMLQGNDACTVPLAVMGTVSALLLLLLCICVILCYKEKRQAKSTLQEAKRIRMFHQSENRRSSAAKVTGGKVNLAYSVEGLTDAGHKDLITETQSQTDFVSIQKRQGSGAAAANNKNTEGQDASKTDVPEDFDIDMEDPETAKAAVAIQSQFRKFQKKKRVEKS
ncbi:uncharacterized protein LOC142994540 isoform X2 [Genypterus blacodes]